MDYRKSNLSLLGIKAMLQFKLGELFCGPGGLGLGAKLANNAQLKHIWASDYDRDSCKTYQNNIHPKKMICKDIRKLDFKTLEHVNALAFGFPCNDFSRVGEQKGINGAFGCLYKYCVKAVRHFHPFFFVAENVSGIKNADEGKAFEIILSEFRKCGYNLFPHLYKFEEYGVPQRRHRMLIVGIREDIPVEYSIPSTCKYKKIDNSAQKALRNIPENAANNEQTKQSPIVIKRLEHIKEGENAFNANIPSHLQLNVKGAKMSQIYKRLTAGEPAYTITGSGGGGTHVYHWKEPRALTNRERARLQTFPDNFIFEGTKESVRKQIGMAVPPQGAKIIFEQIFECFNNAKLELFENEPVVLSTSNL